MPIWIVRPAGGLALGYEMNADEEEFEHVEGVDDTHDTKVTVEIW